MEQDNFTVLENKAIGRNISMYRKIRDMKASDVAERLGMKEASYTRYERGEASITVDIIQQVAQILKVDPITMLSVHPSIFIEIGQSNGNDSPIGIHGYYNHQTSNDQQNQMMLKLMENVIALNERLMALLEKGK
jgi:transcriptional regulator with XRE-family HTH domain